jgi:cytosine permease
MLFIVFLETRKGIAIYSIPNRDSFGGFCRVIDIVIGYFATAGAAGADFGMNNRNAKDVRIGGLIGIVAASFYAGTLPLLSTVGAHGLHPDLKSFSYDAVVGSVGGILAASMFLLYAVASIPSGCFCAFIAGNSFNTMFPSVPRIKSSLVGVTVALLLAITGMAANLVTFFLIVGASFGPICGAMLADYVLSGSSWRGPREGVNWAGYVAWASGFLVGVLPFLPVPATWVARIQPVTLYSFAVGFAVYVVLSKMGLETERSVTLDNLKLTEARRVGVD